MFWDTKCGRAQKQTLCFLSSVGYFREHTMEMIGAFPKEKTVKHAHTKVFSYALMVFLPAVLLLLAIFSLFPHRDDHGIDDLHHSTHAFSGSKFYTFNPNIDRHVSLNMLKFSGLRLHSM